MTKLKREWINGIQILWRVFLLFFAVSVTYEFGLDGVTFVSEAIGFEPAKKSFLQIVGLLCIISLPVIVSYISNRIGLKAGVFDFSLSKRMKNNGREPGGAVQPDNPPVKL
jgi:hypothetical protein